MADAPYGTPNPGERWTHTTGFETVEIIAFDPATQQVSFRHDDGHETMCHWQWFWPNFLPPQQA